MPVMRGADGEIIVEQTDRVEKAGRAPAERNEAEPMTDPRKPPSGRGADSLFAATEDHRDRLEARTARMDAARGSGGGKTRIARRQSSPSSEVPASDDPMSDPLVGWLVIVRGPGQGRALPLGSGMNSIGRGADARVRVDFGDDLISRAEHARLAYDPRRRRYHLSHGGGSNLTYLNGEVVMGASALESGATIEIGATTFRFQAFCSEDFDWSDVDD